MGNFCACVCGKAVNAQWAAAGKYLCKTLLPNWQLCRRRKEKKKRKLKSKGCIAQAETESDDAADAHPRERVAS